MIESAKAFFAGKSEVMGPVTQVMDNTYDELTGVVSDFAEPIGDFLKEYDAESASDLQTPNSHFSSDEYLAMPAVNKMAELWAEVSATAHETGKFPGIKLAGIFVESMTPSFDQPGDAMPHTFWGTRTKYIHSVGTVGKVKFVSTDNHPYTGIFKGANHGLVRFSSAAAPVATGQPLAPGLGLKFLRDGQDSANLVAMYSVNGQPGDWNFFANDFTNHIGSASGLALQALAKKFATATKYIQQVGLSNFADTDESGNRLAAEDVVVPFSLRFEPHSDVKSLFPKELPGSDPMVYVSQLESVPDNASLYNVYAMSGPTEQAGTETLIGTLQLDGTLTRTKWGDENLFFRHQFESDDLKQHPEWDKYLPKRCPFMGLGL